MPKIGDERFALEHISYSRWCEMARERGWKGENDADGLRSYCEPEEAAAVTYFIALPTALEAARAIFRNSPDDSAFGAIIIEKQVLAAAHDDSGNLIAGCNPEWESQIVYEVTSDGDVVESHR